MKDSVLRRQDVWVRPRQSLKRNGVLSFLTISLVLFGALYLLSAPLGTWPAVVLLHFGMTTIFIIALLRYRATHVRVVDGQLEYHGFLRRKWSVAVSSVSTVDVVDIYLANATETSRQLLLRDAAGARVLRMRGRFWQESDMQAIADALGKPVTTRPNPLTMRKFLTEYPGCAFWFEGRPTVMVGAGIAAAVACLAAVTALMVLTGIGFIGS